MRIVRNLHELHRGVLVLGMFDGVHRGHQELLLRGLAAAQELRLPLQVCTFEPHPLQLLRPQIAPPLLTTLSEKSRLMASLGVDTLCVLPFTRRRAEEEPEAFLQEVEDSCHPACIVVGFNYTFGHRGRGNAQMLEAYGHMHDVRVDVVPEVMIAGSTVSSTRIRALLQQGDVHEAAHLLGHGYTLSGVVEDGKRIGRTLGFPTANVKIPRGKALPAYGVYVCWMETERCVYPAVVNVGRHPTLPEGSVTVEAHALDASPDLYGQRVRLTFLDFLRAEQQFSGVEELRSQIARDKRSAAEYFEVIQ